MWRDASLKASEVVSAKSQILQMSGNARPTGRPPRTGLNVLKHETTRNCRVADRRCCLDETSETVIEVHQKYCAWPCRLLYVTTPSLYTTRSDTSSQWSSEYRAAATSLGRTCGYRGPHERQQSKSVLSVFLACHLHVSMRLQCQNDVCYTLSSNNCGLAGWPHDQTRYRNAYHKTK